MDRLESTIARNFYHPNLRQAVQRHAAACPICPKVRTTHQPYGQLAPRNAPISPWSEVHVDSIGPWTIQFLNGVAIYHDATMESSHLKPSDPTTIPLSFDALTPSQIFSRSLIIQEIKQHLKPLVFLKITGSHLFSSFEKSSMCLTALPDSP